jgi:predicted transcriptional regulator
MASSTTLTVRVAPKVKKQLDRLAISTKRTKSFLAGEAIADYVDRELEIVEGIKRGIEDMKAGRLIPHDEAMRQLDATIAAAIARKRK